MSVTSIREVLSLPDRTPLSAVQGLVTEVYERRDVKGGKTVQDAKLRDGSGAEVKLAVWDHPPIDTYKGREVIIQSGPSGGLKVNFDDYKGKNENYISASRTATFQFLEVHQAQNGKTPEKHDAPVGIGTPSVGSVIRENSAGVHGAKVGMAINNATLFMTAAGEAFSEDRVFQLSSKLIELSNRMEKGELFVEKPQDKNPF